MTRILTVTVLMQKKENIRSTTLYIFETLSVFVKEQCHGVLLLLDICTLLCVMTIAS